MHWGKVQAIIWKCHIEYVELQIILKLQLLLMFHSMSIETLNNRPLNSNSSNIG